ncbi:MAG: MFS transporter [Nitriliruptorales bacterium]|nr:MFS transporter [Nitriliruptorales bacterium]
MLERRVEAVEAALDEALRSLPPPAHRLSPEDPLVPGSGLTAGRAVELFEDQVRSRVLDVVARELKQQNLGYYTISSAGHEQNAVVGALLRPNDPCFLHYRSGGLMMARARQHPGCDPIMDTLLSLVASADDPIAQGRHKVWGNRALWVPPQTSTIASHVPKATGTAFAHARARRLGLPTPLPDDAIVCCSFGDASVNHASALAGINAARYSHRRGSPVPILFLCEDNGLGISVDTPRGWIRCMFGDLPHLRYIEADGEIDQIWDAVAGAVRVCRETRTPVFVRLPTVRLWGHAGSDVESGYRTLEQIRSDEQRDPLVRNARRLVTTGAGAPEDLLALVEGTRSRVRETAKEAASRPKLVTRADVMAPLAPCDEASARAEASGAPAAEARTALFGEDIPERVTTPARRTLAAHINAALRDELLRRPEMLVFGEDVGRKGGVYHVTAGLQQAFGSGRVFDTLLDETTILGVAQGAGLLGMLPVPEIQYLAYVHNALDQLRGEAASLSFFSSGQFTNPMVVRVAGLAYQKGFGGHFHNDNSVGALRDIPGLLLAAPSRGDDAARLLRGLLGVAKANGRVGCFLEPIALYHEKDLYEPGDGGWLFDYPPPGAALLPGEVRIYGQGDADLVIVSYANGLRLSLRAARRLEADHGVRARVLDLRWLSPLPFEAVRFYAEACGRVLIADECRATGGGIAEALLSDLIEHGYGGPAASVRAADSYVPLGPAAATVLLSEDDIVRGALDLAGGQPASPA